MTDKRKRKKKKRSKRKSLSFNFLKPAKNYSCVYCKRGFHNAQALASHVGRMHVTEQLQLDNPEIESPGLLVPRSQRRVVEVKGSRGNSIPRPNVNRGRGKPRVYAPKKRGRGAQRSVSRVSRTTLWKLRKVIEYEATFRKGQHDVGRRNAWFQKHGIRGTPTPHATMSSWKKKKAEWVDLTQKDLRRMKLQPKGRGRYHECEKELYELYKARRAKGFRVTYKWLRGRMKNIARRRKPRGLDFDDYKGFGNAWCRQFCKRWHISLQRRTTKKSIHYYARLHEIQVYHRKLVFDLQNPANYGDDANSWISKKWYIENHRDPDANEDDLDHRDEIVFSESEVSESDTE